MLGEGRVAHVAFTVLLGFERDVQSPTLGVRSRRCGGDCISRIQHPAALHLVNCEAEFNSFRVLPGDFDLGKLIRVRAGEPELNPGNGLFDKKLVFL
jgi:hypothetical protein